MSGGVQERPADHGVPVEKGNQPGEEKGYVAGPWTTLLRQQSSGAKEETAGR